MKRLWTLFYMLFIVNNRMNRNFFVLFLCTHMYAFWFSSLSFPDARHMWTNIYMKGCLNLYLLTEVVRISRKQSFHFTSCKPVVYLHFSCSLLHLLQCISCFNKWASKGIDIQNPHQNSRRRKSPWKCCLDLCKWQWLGNSNESKFKSNKYRVMI